MTIIQKRIKTTINQLAAGAFTVVFKKIQRTFKIFIKRLLIPNGVFFNLVEVIITEKCTLKCKKCASLMQYYTNQKHVDIQQIMHDIDLLMERVDYIEKIRLIGGEPLMVKELPEILLHLQKYKSKYASLQLTTNATLVPSQHILSSMKQADVVVTISDYADKSKKLDMLVAELKKHKISYFSTVVTWREIQQVIDNTNRNGEDSNNSFEKCSVNCYNLFNGKLYYCSFLAHGDNIRLFPDDKRNFIDLADTSTTKNSILQWQLKKIAPPGCQFCTGNSFDLPMTPTAEQVEHPLSYEKFER